METRQDSVIGGYTIVRRMRAGGLGAAYLAQHPRLPRHDVLFVVDPAIAGQQSYPAAFTQAIDAAGELRHRNLVPVLDRGDDNGRLWVATGYVEGTDVARIVAGHRLPPAEAARIVAEVAAGLDDAHRHGLIHGGLQAADILVADGTGAVLVTSLGLAATRAAALADTTAYTAPEVLAGAAADRRADVYSLGCVLYELLTGSTPFPHRTAVGVISAHLRDPIPRVTQRVQSLPAGIDEVVARALAKEPAQRFESCGSLAVAAAHALSEPPQATDGTRRTASIAAAIAAVLALLAGAAIVAHPFDRTVNGVPVTANSAPAAPNRVIWTNLNPGPPGIVPGWQAVRSAKHHVAFDLPQSWIPGQDRVVGWEGNNGQMLAISSVAQYGLGHCLEAETAALAHAGVMSATDFANPVDAATSIANAFAVVTAEGPAHEKPSDLTEAISTPATVTGMPAAHAVAYAKPFPGQCTAPKLTVHTMAAQRPNGDIVALVVIADQEVPEAPTEVDLDTIVTSFRAVP